MVRSASHGALANKALTYLIRNKDSYGTWQSTQATILALKSLIASLGSSLEDNRGTVTVLLNGTNIIDNQPVLGCTGGAMWSDESRPGPIYLQGDHGAVSYRNLVLRPVVK